MKEKIISLINISLTGRSVKRMKAMSWNRSKILLLGKGGVGKTSLALNMQDRPFVESWNSTVGSDNHQFRTEYLKSSDGAVEQGKFIPHNGNSDITASAWISTANRNKASTNTEPGSNTSRNKDSGNGSAEKEKNAGKPFTAAGENQEVNQEPEVSDSEEVLKTSQEPKFNSNAYSPEQQKTGENQASRCDDDDFFDIPEDDKEQNQESYFDESFGRILSENVSHNTKFIITLYDFGGQDIFHVFHSFFMTKNAVYFVVFDLSDLLSEVACKVESCLHYIHVWLNSIALHTQKRNQTHPAVKNVERSAVHMSPIALVGTKADVKDVIHNKAKLLEASVLLKTRFSNHVAWTFLIKFFPDGHFSEDSDFVLNFFPIDNRSRCDFSVKSLHRLLCLSEEAISEFELLQVEKPLSWFRATDMLLKERSESSFIEYSRVVSIAEICGIRNSEVDQLLLFLSEAGILMWINDSNNGLRDVVILDPTDYLIKPATRVICNHLPTRTEGVAHSGITKRTYMEKRSAECIRMLEYGLVGVELGKDLMCGSGYSFCQSDYHYEKVLYILKKYDLMIPCKIPAALQLNKNEDFNDVIYFFPSLSPVNPAEYDLSKVEDEQEVFKRMTDRLGAKYDWIRKGFRACETFYFAFTFSEQIVNVPLLSKHDVAQHGFLPNGIFDRFIGKLFEGISTASENLGDLLNRSSFIGFKDCVVLHYLDRELRITHLSDCNLIQIDVAPFPDFDSGQSYNESADDAKDVERVSEKKDCMMVVLLDTLYEKLRSVIEHFDGLKVIALLPFTVDEPHFTVDTRIDRNSPLLPFSELIFIVQQQLCNIRYLSIDGTQQISNVHWTDLQDRFSNWLEIKSIHPLKNRYSNTVS
jgi:GTPase SAR1 family protein